MHAPFTFLTPDDSSEDKHEPSVIQLIKNCALCELAPTADPNEYPAFLEAKN
jgi:hypothetical protein